MCRGPLIAILDGPFAMSLPPLIHKTELKWYALVRGGEELRESLMEAVSDCYHHQLLATWMDIQDLKDAQAEQLKKAEIEASEQKYRSLAEAIPQIVWTSPHDGDVNYFNKRWYEFTGKFFSHISSCFSFSQHLITLTPHFINLFVCFRTDGS